MKVLLLNGSPKANGNTAITLAEMEKVFAQEGVECEIVHVGKEPVRGCMDCNACRKTGKCVFDDIVNELAPKFQACDGLVPGCGTPPDSAKPGRWALPWRLPGGAGALPPLTS